MPVYFDNSTITKPSSAAISKMIPFFTDYWGTSSAPHQKGQELFPAIEESYRAIYSMLGAKESDDFVFTSSGAEAVNQAILSGYFDITLPTGKNHFICSMIDEAAAIMAMGRLEKLGTVTKMLTPNSKGYIDDEVFAHYITPRTAFLSLSAANALTGVIQPTQKIADLCKERGIRFHLDMSHILGKLYFETEDLGADLLTFNGSLLHAPKGTGGLLIKKGVKLSPLIAGGVEQGGKRAGDLDVPSLVALGVASTETSEARDLICMEVARLRNKLESQILETCPGAVVFFKDEERIPNCTAIGFPGIANEALLFALNRKQVYASIGGGAYQKISLILEACGIPPALANTALSFSLSRETTDAEVDLATEIISEIVRRMTRLQISP